MKTDLFRKFFTPLSVFACLFCGLVAHSQDSSLPPSSPAGDSLAVPQAPPPPPSPEEYQQRIEDFYAEKSIELKAEADKLRDLNALKEAVKEQGATLSSEKIVEIVEQDQKVKKLKKELSSIATVITALKKCQNLDDISADVKAVEEKIKKELAEIKRAAAQSSLSLIKLTRHLDQLNVDPTNFRKSVREALRVGDHSQEDFLSAIIVLKELKQHFLTSSNIKIWRGEQLTELNFHDEYTKKINDHLRFNKDEKLNKQKLYQEVADSMLSPEVDALVNALVLKAIGKSASSDPNEATDLKNLLTVEDDLILSRGSSAQIETKDGAFALHIDANRAYYSPVLDKAAARLHASFSKQLSVEDYERLGEEVKSRKASIASKQSEMATLKIRTERLSKLIDPQATDSVGRPLQVNTSAITANITQCQKAREGILLLDETEVNSPKIQSAAKTIIEEHHKASKALDSIKFQTK